MRAFKSWRWVMRKKHALFDGVTCGVKMKQLQFMGIIFTVMLFIVYRTMNYQYWQTEIDERLDPFYTAKGFGVASNSLKGLPRGIIQARSDLELKPLWSTSSSRSKVNISSSHNLLAIPVGIKQKSNVDAMVQKFLSENFIVMLFHYDGNVDGWWDLSWSKKAIHIVAQNQTKWWFAKRFLHPAVVSLYDYIFLWDEDLGVENFHPGRYLKIVKSEELEISQPALDPSSTGIHHRITIRSRTKKFHRRVWDVRGSTKCAEDSEGPPCTGQVIINHCCRNHLLFVEGMAPVFSRSAWHCAWHLIQNDLVHGWGMDMKLGYCALGDRTENVGIVDSEYVVHQGLPTLGGASARKKHKHTVDMRAEIRRQSTSELQIFKERWEQAVKNDRNWVDPFQKKRRLTRRRNLRLHI
ncbi:Phosphate import ATP-binding protein like [Actinidia chinensis var. chinensis]|uniref:Phosphate import ATP-binding protein like n=1 Tax=Actinidia chinensis var. chinensis TaxID=1590841 RepID=A0A2R6RAT1_ACTCC|nr:Phosphate import ATP-binding protein like [Actinidia chinensis var. chinensis]